MPPNQVLTTTATSREGRRTAPDACSARSPLRCVAHDLGHDVVHVALTGTLDIATALQADRTMRATQADAQLVILDLRQVKFIGRTAVRLALMADARARRVRGRLVVVAARVPAPRLLSLAKLDRRLEVVDRLPVACFGSEPA